MRNYVLFSPPLPSRFTKHAALLSSLLLAGCTKTPEESSMADKYFHRYGVEVSKADFETKGATGKVISHLSDGRISEAHYVQGSLHGEKTLTFPYSDIIEITLHYKQGRLVSKTLHNMQGTPYQKTEYFNEEQSRLSIQSWYPAGSPRSKESWDLGRLLDATYFDPHHKLLSRVETGYGQRSVLNDQGALVLQEEYKGGWLVSQMTYDPSSATLMSEVPFVKGKKQGIASFFSPQGELQRTESWVDDLLDGEVILYEKDYPSVIYTYVAGVKEGLEYRYRGETLAETWEWKNDKRHGEHKVYVDDVLVRTEYYYEGVKVSKQGYEQLLADRDL